jgi:hypothetical protein
MKFRYHIIILLLGILPFNAFTQNDVSIVISDILQEYLENFVADADYSDLEQTLINYNKKPLSLNTATDKQLSDLLFLSDKQVNDILEYRIKFKGYRTIYELAAIPSIDSMTLARLKYFSSTEENPVKQQLKPLQFVTRGVNRLNVKYQQNLEEEKGYKTDTSGSHYLGSPYRLMIRYDHQISDKVSYGFIAEKDPGEELFKGSQKNGFDFYSGHFYIAGDKWIKQLVIGDYHANFGQGLAFYSGMSFGKSANASGLFRYSPGLRPSLSTNESNFLRGIGITTAYKNIRLTTFFSHRSMDGRGVNTDSFNFEENYFTSLTSTGYHRTVTEIAKKNNLTETLAGAHLKAGFSKVDIGFTAVGGKFSVPLLASDQLYKLYAFEGSSFLNFGTDYSYTFKNYHLFGELGFDGKTFANITGLNIDLNSRMSASILYRNYPKEYQAVYANAFRENSTTQNEQGIYVSFNILPAKNWTINMYLDHFYFPWVKYGTDAPSKGLDYLVDITCRPSSRLSLNGRVRYKYHEMNAPENTTSINYLTSAEQYNFRLSLAYNVSRSISLVTRAEYNKYSSNNIAVDGLMFYQDLKFTFLSEKLKISMRYAFVNSANYETRFYTFENDMPYSFSISSLYDKSLRYYLLAEYELKEYLSFWLKLSQTDYLDKNSIGSGLSEIDGNKKTEVKFMLQVEF